MPDSGHYTRDEVLRVLTGPTVETDLPGGGVMIVKGGVVGLGWSHREAAVDWWQEFAGLIWAYMGPLPAPVLPKWEPLAWENAVRDIAMTELFGGFGADFYAAYGEEWPLSSDYAVHRDVYNLYHVLNHLNLFGGGYLAQAERMVEQLLALAG